jgi:hypothetical protein
MKCKTFKARIEARSVIFDYIELYYNQQKDIETIIGYRQLSMKNSILRS